MPENIHATCIVIGERGILIRGASGAGKSAFARALIAHAQPAHYARLVADDRVIVEAVHGRVIAVPHPALAGQMEQRGLGILATPHEPACVLALVVDLDSPRERLPPDAERSTTIAAVTLPRLATGNGADALPLVSAWLSGARAQQ